jgi:hypothetical protein
LPIPEEVFDVRLEPIRELTGEVASLLDLAIARSRAHAFADEEVKELISGAAEGHPSSRGCGPRTRPCDVSMATPNVPR